MVWCKKKVPRNRTSAVGRLVGEAVTRSVSQAASQAVKEAVDKTWKQPLTEV